MTHSGFGKGRPQARVWGRSPQGGLEAEPPASNEFLGFLKKNTHFSKVFLSKKDTPVSKILTTRIGIHNARAKGGAMAPWSPLRSPIWSIHFFSKKLKSSHERPPGPAPGGGCPPLVTLLVKGKPTRSEYVSAINFHHVNEGICNG